MNERLWQQEHLSGCLHCGVFWSRSTEWWSFSVYFQFESEASGKCLQRHFHFQLKKKIIQITIIINYIRTLRTDSRFLPNKSDCSQHLCLLDGRFWVWFQFWASHEVACSSSPCAVSSQSPKTGSLAWLEAQNCFCLWSVVSFLCMATAMNSSTPMTPIFNRKRMDLWKNCSYEMLFWGRLMSFILFH